MTTYCANPPDVPVIGDPATAAIPPRRAVELDRGAIR